MLIDSPILNKSDKSCFPILTHHLQISDFVKPFKLKLEHTHKINIGDNFGFETAEKKEVVIAASFVFTRDL